MKTYQKRIILALIIIAAITVIKYFNLDTYLTFENLKNYKGQLLEHVKNNYFPAVLLFILIYIVVIAFQIPGAAVLSLSGGFLFGMAGVLYVNLGATGGAVLAFLAARFIIGDWIQARYGDKMESFNRELEKNGRNYLLTLRLIPVFPFFLINLLAGLTGISLMTFFWITAVGIIPGSVVYVYAGTQLGSINTMSDIISWQMLSALVLLGLLAVIPVVIQKFKKKSTGTEK